MFPSECWRLGSCAGERWIETGVVSQHTDQFQMSEMLQVIDEQLLLLMEWNAHLLGGVGLGSGVFLKDKLTKINEQILDLEEGPLSGLWPDSMRSTISWHH